MQEKSISIVFIFSMHLSLNLFFHLLKMHEICEQYWNDDFMELYENLAVLSVLFAVKYFQTICSTFFSVFWHVRENRSVRNAYCLVQSGSKTKCIRILTKERNSLLQHYFKCIRGIFDAFLIHSVCQQMERSS